MSESGRGQGSPVGGPGVAAGDAGEGRVLHARSFKLRFAAQREPGRSYVSLVKPLGLPATVTDKFYTRSTDDDGEDEEKLRRIQDMFERGPRDRLAAPLTESHVYGWYRGGEAACWRRDPRLAHHIRDSSWLKSRLLVLAADDKLKRKH